MLYVKGITYKVHMRDVNKATVRPLMGTLALCWDLLKLSVLRMALLLLTRKCISRRKSAGVYNEVKIYVMSYALINQT